MQGPRRRLYVAMAAIAAVVIIVVYSTIDPAEGMMPRCWFKVLTGWDCPGCGSQRALHALLHGHPDDAWRFNPALFVMLPLAAAYAIAELCPARWPRLRMILLQPKVIASIGVGIILWTIGRNIL